MTNQTSMLNAAELDLVSGGMDPNYKECVNGTTAGGGAGVYPNNVECAGGLTNADVYKPFFDAVKKGGGK
jgi:hypothetical protein